MKPVLKSRKAVGLLALPLFALAAVGCASEGNGGGNGTTEPASEVTELVFAHSYGTGHAHHRCGAQVIADTINGQPELGLEIKVFSDNQLGEDASRFTSVIAGDIDFDLQGSSAIAATYPEVGVLDAAYVFDDVDHMFRYLDSDASESLKQDMLDATGVRVLDAFYFGDRTFSANSPIRTPDDLKGLRMRFPGTPAYLLNAEALGAEVVAIAFAELFIGLQQGLADGQENPIPTVKDLSLDEVQTHISLNRHQVGFQFLIVNDNTWTSLNDTQREALTEAITDARAQDRDCILSDEQEILDDWKATGKMTVVEDVDRQAFIDKAEAFFLNHFTGAELELYQSIRAAR